MFSSRDRSAPGAAFLFLFGKDVSTVAIDANPCDDRLHQQFLAMLPQIIEQAQVAFRQSAPEEREEPTAETTANAYCAFVRLAESPIRRRWAQFAIRQIRAGHRVGTSANVHDVSSAYCQKAQGLTLERLDRFDVEEGRWREAVVEDKRSTPAEIAACRIDFGEWLARLPKRTAQIAGRLALGESTKEAARSLRLSPGRISQLRRELKESWEAFQGEAPQSKRAPAPA